MSSLNDRNEYARNTDPETSQDAGLAMKNNPKRQSIADACMQAIYAHPGMCAGEIGERTGLGHARVWRRISDLKRKGLVFYSGAVRWHGRLQKMVFPVQR